jgi:hypothetical protein
MARQSGSSEITESFRVVDSVRRRLSVQTAAMNLKNEVLSTKALSATVQVYVSPKPFRLFFETFTPAVPGEEMRNMEKIRDANRRKRRTKPNLRARSGQSARRVNRQAKTPAVQILTIGNVPTDILEAIDELAAGQGRSRSNFVRRELQPTAAGYPAKGTA